MAYGYHTIKTEHSGAKNGGGYWGRRAEAKVASRVTRRQHDKAAIVDEIEDIEDEENDEC